MSRSLARLAFITSLLGLAAVSMSAQTGIFPSQGWSMPGVTGVTDKTGLSIAQFNSTGSIQISGSVGAATLMVRYPVSGVACLTGRTPFDPNSDGPDERISLRAMIRDTGSDAQVKLTLWQLEAETQKQTVLATINSNYLVQGSTAYPTPASTEYLPFVAYLPVPTDWCFDFGRYVYYVEAQLVKSASTGNPGLKVLQICNPDSTCHEVG